MNPPLDHRQRAKALEILVANDGRVAFHGKDDPAGCELAALERRESV